MKANSCLALVHTVKELRVRHEPKVGYNASKVGGSDGRCTGTGILEVAVICS